ncbi:Myotubularin-related protein 14 [Lamellibrachia satsuma]|nr:Myotubularin-related protein 14 [Lamellibrachia satsuma]
MIPSWVATAILSRWFTNALLIAHAYTISNVVDENGGVIGNHQEVNTFLRSHISAMSLPEDDFHVEELRSLLEHALQNTYKSRENDPKGGSIMFNCLRLFGKDYQYSVVSNTNGELCNHYPSKVVVLEYVLAPGDGCPKHSVQSLYNVDELKELFSKARFARCRARFSIPVILFEGKHICRSATISGGAEIYGRSGIDFFFTGGESIPGGSTNNDESSEWQLFNRIRGQDIRLLKQFSVSTICDLMVEKKKVKFGMNVTSSEKVDKENRYADFSIMSVPYPGCEFFREWRQNGYMAEGMMFDWNQGYVDADLDLPDQVACSIDWTKYRKISALGNIAELASQLHPLCCGGLETGQVAKTIYMASLPIPNSHKAKGRPIKNVSLEQELQPQS